jgi:hypothetical protein
MTAEHLPVSKLRNEVMSLCADRQQLVTRREMLQHASSGLGFLALAAMTSEAAAREESSNNPLEARTPPRPLKAKRVIFLFQGGGPPHMDTFDYKPLLDRNNDKNVHGKDASEFASIIGRSFQNGASRMVATPAKWEFKRHGKSGLVISSLFPHLARHADDLCVINSLYCDFNNHPEAALQLHTGQGVLRRPALGAWSVYGLGTENQDLPGFITLGMKKMQHAQTAFLPAIYGATDVTASKGRGILRFLDNPQVSRPVQRQQLDLIQEMNRDMFERTQRDAKIDDVIRGYELAFRMQGVMPAVLDLSKEKPQTLEMYGCNNSALSRYNMPEKCLLARRMIEAGVRFVEIECASNDAHDNLEKGYGEAAFLNDQPVAALLTDLKRRGLLDDTLVICGGEFGRTPWVLARSNLDGREHNSTAFSMWLAGGGLKGGITYGKSDELGANVIQNKVHVHDLHATILHLLGLDHEKLTYRYSGRDFRLTDIYGNVVQDIIA